MSHTGNTLSARNLDLTLGRRQVLSAITTHIRRGTVLGILGPNGAGKTSLLRALGGLVAPASGQVELDGKPLHTVTPHERARRIGYLPQGRDCAWPISAFDVVLLGLLPHRTAWSRVGNNERAAVHKALQATGAGGFVNRPIDTLSGGEAARVLLARVLVTHTDFLLADEPTAGLDPAASLRVLELLRGHSRSGTGIGLVLHDLTLAARYCDHIVLLHEGHVLDEGTPEQVLNEDNLAQAYGVDAHIGHDAAGALITPYTSEQQA